MGLGIVAIVALLWLRLGTAAPALPAQLALPPGEMAEAVTLTPSRAIVVTRTGRVLVYDLSGTLRGEVTLAQ